MAVNIEIKSNLPEGSELPDVVSLCEKHGYKYGVLDNTYKLDEGNLGEEDWYKVIYNPEKIGRGFEMFVGNDGYKLIMPLPNTESDINMFYDFVKELCGILDTTEFVCDDEPTDLGYIDYIIESSLDVSKSAVSDICEKVISGETDSYSLYSAVYPMVIGRAEALMIDGDLQALENWLDDMQKIDAVYPTIRFYNHPDGQSIFATVFIADSYPTIIPTVKNVPWPLGTVDYWFFSPVRGILIPFDDLLPNVEKFADFDGMHMIVSLDENKLNELMNKYSFILDTSTYEPSVYWGIRIDDTEGHSSKIEDKNLSTPVESGANHLAVYMRYAAKNKLFSEDFLAKVSDETVKQMADSIEGARKRVLEDSFIAKEIFSRYFNEDFSRFTRDFYVFGGNKNGYPHRVDMVAEEYFGTEKYNSEEFQDEAYLFTPFDEKYYKNLSSHIDKEWKRYKKLRGMK